jgi:transposase
MDRDFDGLYSTLGRASIAPERLLRATLRQVIYTIGSERQLVEQIDFNLLFRWFVGLSMDESMWDHSILQPEPRPVVQSRCGAAVLPAHSSSR